MPRAGILDVAAFLACFPVLVCPFGPAPVTPAPGSALRWSVAIDDATAAIETANPPVVPLGPPPSSSVQPTVFVDSMLVYVARRQVVPGAPLAAHPAPGICDLRMSPLLGWPCPPAPTLAPQRHQRARTGAACIPAMSATHTTHGAASVILTSGPFGPPTLAQTPLSWPSLRQTGLSGGGLWLSPRHRTKRGRNGCHQARQTCRSSVAGETT